MPRGRPKLKEERSPEIGVRLLASDYARLTELSTSKGATKTDLVRQAILEFLDRSESKVQEQTIDRLALKLGEMEQRLLAQQKKDVERLAKLGSRNLIDVGTINQVLYRRADKESRDKLWDAARQGSLKRLGVGRKSGDSDAAELAKMLAAQDESAGT